MFSLRTIKYTLGELWKKIFRRVSRYARNYSLVITYFVVLPIISLGGSKLTIKKSNDDTFWKNLKSKPDARVTFIQLEKNWLMELLKRTLETKNFRTLTFLPFIFILKIFEDQEENPSSAALFVYTLY